jgi:branched-chain amino acid transport system permease protein
MKAATPLAWSHLRLLPLFAAALVAPFLLSSYLLSQAALFGIFVIVGLGVMVLVGYTGLTSIGHAAFFAIGAYGEALLLKAGLPFPFSLLVAAAIAAGVGLVVGLPALRLSGLYLAMATLAFAVIVGEIIGNWRSLTGGHTGMRVPPLTLGGVPLGGERPFYYVVLFVVVVTTWLTANLMRARTGRAFRGISESELAAQSIWVDVARYKLAAFLISAVVTAIAGALYAHKTQFISPESFTIGLSVEMLILVVVGGLGTIIGAYFGAAFVVFVPVLLVIARDYLPVGIGSLPGLEAGVFGLTLILVILFEPHGMAGQWRRLTSILKVRGGAR